MGFVINSGGCLYYRLTIQDSSESLGKFYSLTVSVLGKRYRRKSGVVRSEYKRCNAILAIKVISVPS